MEIHRKDDPLVSLEPENIAWSMGRTRENDPRAGWLKKAFTGTLLLRWQCPVRPELFAGAIGLLGVTTAIVVASFAAILLSGPGATSALGMVIFQRQSAGTITWGLLEDPVGLISLIVTLATPFFCARQVLSIKTFVQANQENATYRLDPIGKGSAKRLEKHAKRANKLFRLIGAPLPSLGVLGLAIVLAILLYSRISDGLLKSWNFTTTDPDRWSRRVFEGWWANWDNHRLLAIILIGAGAYMFYFVIKQILMGGVFAYYSYVAMQEGLCVVPNLLINTDGRWGLRHVRSFLFWTYFSTLADFVMTLGVLTVWLHFGPWTTPVVLLVMTINCIVVLFPTSVGYTSVRREKDKFVGKMLKRVEDSPERDALIERIWSLPNLTFRLRNTITAATLYFLIPLALLLVSAILKSD
jgi:hypothetical protein